MTTIYSIEDESLVRNYTKNNVSGSDNFFIKDEIEINDESTIVDVCNFDDTLLSMEEIVLSSTDESFIDVCDSDIEEILYVKTVLKDIGNNSEKMLSNGIEIINTSISDLADTSEIEKSTTDFETEKKRKREFSTKNLFEYYCSHCDKVMIKNKNKKLKKCKLCHNNLKFVCIKCKKQFKIYQTMYVHLKYSCSSENAPKKKTKDNLAIRKEKGMKKNNRFRTDNLYQMYCLKCDKGIRKILGVSMTNCSDCENLLIYECLKCNRRHKSFVGLYLHLKLKCSQEKETTNSENDDSNTSKNEKLKFSKNFQTCFKCGIEEIQDSNENQECKMLKLFQCNLCLFKCCQKNNLKCHLETEHQVTNMNEVDTELTGENQSKMRKMDRELKNENRRKRRKDTSLNEKECQTIDRQNVKPEEASFSRELTNKNQTKRRSVNASLNEKEWQNIDRKSVKPEEASFSEISRKENIEGYCPYCKCTSVINHQLIKNNCKNCRKAVLYRCKVCRRLYSKVNSVYSHLKYECSNTEPKFQCQHCSYKAKQKGNLQTHIQRKHTTKRCPGCGKSFRNQILFRNHRLKDCMLKASRLHCRYCSFSCLYETQLQNHVLKEHKSKYVCKQCGKRYSSLLSLKKHMALLCAKMFKCAHCSYNASLKLNLARHLHQTHPDLYQL